MESHCCILKEFVNSELQGQSRAKYMTCTGFFFLMPRNTPK